MDNFDPYNVFLAIATNIPQQLKTGFVLQGHICHDTLMQSFSLFQISIPAQARVIAVIVSEIIA